MVFVIWIKLDSLVIFFYNTKTYDVYAPVLRMLRSHKRDSLVVSNKVSTNARILQVVLGRTNIDYMTTRLRMAIYMDVDYKNYKINGYKDDKRCQFAVAAVLT